MKKFIQLLQEQLNLFLGNTRRQPISEENHENADILATIQLALYKKAAIHVIYSRKKSITGEIAKWDDKRQQLIVKNFSKNLSAIIYLRDIEKISLVPDTITQSQKASTH